MALGKVSPSVSNRRSKFRKGLGQSRRSGEALEHSPGRVEARNPGQADAKTARLWGQVVACGGDWSRWADLGKAGLSLCRGDGPHLLGSWSLLGGPGYRSVTEDLKMRRTWGHAALSTLLSL